MANGHQRAYTGPLDKRPVRSAGFSAGDTPRSGNRVRRRAGVRRDTPAATPEIG